MTIRAKSLLTAFWLAVSPLAAAAADLPGLEHFPYEVIAVPGSKAYATWEDLHQEGKITPVIIGNAETAASLALPFDPGYPTSDSPQAIVEKAAGLVHPQSMQQLRDNERSAMIDWARAEGYEDLARSFETHVIHPAIVGEWRDDVPANPGLLTLSDYATGQPYETVYIALLPTTDVAEVPAYLKFGGWNANPPPEYHVAAFRSWHDRFGAVPVVVTHDTLEFRVAKPPPTREAAMDLAYEHYAYSEDIVTQGIGTVSLLGGALKNGTWWWFWWD